MHTRDMKSKVLFCLLHVFHLVVFNSPHNLHFLCYLVFSPDAYKQADGRKVDNKRVLVDVERGRTVPNWRPRRLGGGLGSSRMGGADTDKKDSARYIHYLILITYIKSYLIF